MTDFGGILHGGQEELLAELDAAGVRIRGKDMHCWMHKDEHPSAGIYQGEDGIWRYKCHSCQFNGDIWDVRAKRTGRPLREVLAAVGDGKRRDIPKPPTAYSALTDLMQVVNLPITATYKYTNPDTGNVDMVVFRCTTRDGKTFRQGHQCERGWVLKAPAKPWPLYNRTRVRNADCVVVVEGEKCVHCLYDHGVVATTSPGGAGKASLADWRPLNGKKVYLWPDNDADGKGTEHMRDVCKLLMQLPDPPAVYWIDPAGLGIKAKGDVVDFVLDIPNELRKRAVADVIESAERMADSREVADLFERMIDGRTEAVPFPWRVLSRETKALYPGTVTILCGDPGDGKTFAMYQCLAHWHFNGVPIAVYELEEDKPWHLRRIVAQIASNSNLLDDEWCRQNPGDVRDAMAAHQDTVDRLGARMMVAPDTPVSLATVARWVEERAVSGARIIAVDPITAAEVGGNQWEEDLKFLLAIKSTARKHQCSVVLVTHPKKGRGKGGMDDLAGGAAYARFSQTILWIHRLDPPREVSVVTSVGRTEYMANRTMWICKARNGRGTGLRIAFDFEGASVTFNELGISVKDG